MTYERLQHFITFLVQFKNQKNRLSYDDSIIFEKAFNIQNLNENRDEQVNFRQIALRVNKIQDESLRNVCKNMLNYVKSADKAL